MVGVRTALHYRSLDGFRRVENKRSSVSSHPELHPPRPIRIEPVAAAGAGGTLRGCFEVAAFPRQEPTNNRERVVRTTPPPPNPESQESHVRKPSDAPGASVMSRVERRDDRERRLTRPSEPAGSIRLGKDNSATQDISDC